ncbi:MAG: hypothetical protein ACFCUN_07620, partial [Hyphomicrobiaceae bacterium]
DGLINLDFADVRTVMSDMGTAVKGTGEAEGGQRAVLAAEGATTNPLLNDIALGDAQGVLISIVGGADMTLYEVEEAVNRIRQEVDPEANIIVGATFDPDIGAKMRVSLVAAGMDKTRVRREPLPGFKMPAAALQGEAARFGQSGSHVGHAPDMPDQTPQAADLQRHAAPVHPGAGPPLPPPIPGGVAAGSLAPRDHAPDSPAPPPPVSQPARSRAYEAFVSGSPRGAEGADPQTWKSPNGVVIEPEALPQAPRGSDAPGSQSGQTADHAVQTSASADRPVFKPAMPIEARPDAPRVPPVEAFPPIAQQAYHGAAKANVNVAAAQRAESGSLFRRLMGRGASSESGAGSDGGGKPATDRVDDGGAGGRGRSRR